MAILYVFLEFHLVCFEATGNLAAGYLPCYDVGRKKALYVYKHEGNDREVSVDLFFVRNKDFCENENFSFVIMCIGLCDGRMYAWGILSHAESREQLDAPRNCSVCSHNSRC